MDILLDAFQQLSALVGAAALIAVLINVLKTVGVIKDGQAQTWSAVANFAVLTALVALRIFQPDLDVMELDGQAASLAQVLTVVFAYFIELGGTKVFHNLIKGVPVIGKSFSG